jgi:glycosyltransferase involved in cell wall biosynthesis
MKRIVIDARILVTGIGTYIFNLIASLKGKADGFTIRVLTWAKDAERMRPLCDEVKVVDARIYTIREQFEIPWAARGADLLHVPHYNAPLLYRGKLLVTIHDLIPITDATFKWTVPSNIYARPMLNLVVRKAEHIVTNSEFTKNEIVEHLRVSPAKITAIHLGVSPHFCRRDHQEGAARVAGALGLNRPYLLFVGNLMPHKNLKTLIRAFALLRARKALEQELLIVGDSRRWRTRFLSEPQKQGVAEVVRFVPHVGYEMLPWVYAAADLFILPSFIEGFGLPVLEAMACGTPVVCSRAASLPEVAGDAAEYFEPSSAEDLAAAIERVLNSRERQTELWQKGVERAKQFSWDECARRHGEVYRNLLQ